MAAQSGKIAYLVSLAIVIGMSVSVQRHTAVSKERETEGWKLVSMSAQPAGQKDCREVLGPNPKGRAVLSADGRRLVATVAAGSAAADSATSPAAITELVFERVEH